MSGQQVCTWPIKLALVLALTAPFELAEVLAQTATSVSPIPGVDAALIEDIVTGSRVLADFGVLDGFGHVSARFGADAR
jgi:HCOMODA/2-hydroxy-3-carboxy-muconic semialdehyde decarboxylase